MKYPSQKLILLLFFLMQWFIIKAQDKNSVLLSGYVRDSYNEHELSGANIHIEAEHRLVSSDKQGAFYIQLHNNSYLITSYTGYKSDTILINCKTDTCFVIYLTPVATEIDEIVVKTNNSNLLREQGIVRLNRNEINKIPGFMGETDVIGALKQMPGIQAGGEGNVGIFVRGGSAGQNLILIDDIPLYNPSHLMGFFPVFNADMITSVDLYKGGLPSNFGGKTSSIIDIGIGSVEQDQRTVKGSIGLLSADLTLMQPLFKGKGSIMLSGRRTYINLVQRALKPVIEESTSLLNSTQYYFYDGLGKLTYQLSDRDKIETTWFVSTDKYNLHDSKFDVSNKMYWQNIAGAIRYRHSFNMAHRLKVALIYSRYNFELNANFNQYDFELFSLIEDYGLKVDGEYNFGSQSTFKYGIEYQNHFIQPNKVNLLVDKLNYDSDNRLYADQVSVYSSLSIPIYTNTDCTIGLRSTMYRHLGPYSSTLTNDNGDTFTNSFARGEAIKTYYVADPYFSFLQKLTPISSIKGSLSIAHQFIHLASVASVSLPTDIWLPSTDFIKPQNAKIASIGYYRDFNRQNIEVSVETYFKKLGNLVDFHNGILQNFTNQNLKDNLMTGEGRAYGIEFLVKKKVGIVTGWISYTLSKSDLIFPELNNGLPYPAKYDRTHDLSITLNHQLNSKWNISGVFIFATGNAMTLPQGRYIVQGSIGNHYTSINGFRMPSYHRMDISATYTIKKTLQKESLLNISVYNVYNHANPYYMYYWAEGDLDRYYLNVEPRMISLFPVLPSVSYIFKF